MGIGYRPEQSPNYPPKLISPDLPASISTPMGACAFGVVVDGEKVGDGEVGDGVEVWGGDVVIDLLLMLSLK